MKRILMVLVLATFCLTAFAQKKAKFMKGNIDFLRKPTTILVEFDMSKTSLDGLDSEEEFIDYKTKKAKDPAKWKKGWKKDKINFANTYMMGLNRKFKKTGLVFNDDDPDSKYKMVYRPVHIETGNPMKKSSIKGKLHFYDMETGEEIAILYMPPAYGEQMGPSTPTVGIRLNACLYYSATALAKFYKKETK